MIETIDMLVSLSRILKLIKTWLTHFLKSQSTLLNKKKAPNAKKAFMLHPGPLQYLPQPAKGVLPYNRLRGKSLDKLSNVKDLRKSNGLLSKPKCYANQ